MIRDAAFSKCSRYRYTLTRQWGASTLAIIGLNPSTADAERDDPTIRRCMGFAKRWGYGGIVMLNLFALRSTNPRALYDATDAVGERNDHVLLEQTYERTVLCAWGAHGGLHGRGECVRRLLRDRKLMHLGLTKDGHPRHPLYLRSTEELRSTAEEPPA